MAGIFKKKWVTPGIILGIAGIIAAYFFLQPGEKPEYVLAKAEIGNIVQSVSATGSIKADPTINLHFQKSGKVEEILVEEGERVNKYEVLASLENKTLDLEIKRNQANVNLASAQYNQLKAGNTKEEIRIAESQVLSAQAALDAAKSELLSIQATGMADIELAQLAYEQAEDDMDAAKRDLETTKKLAEQEIAKLNLEGANTQVIALESAYTRAKTGLDIIITTVQESLYLAEDILGIRGAGFLELPLQERDKIESSYYNPAKTDYQMAVSLQGELTAASTNEEIDAAVAAAIKSGNSALVLLTQMGEAFREITLRSDQLETYVLKITALSSKLSTATLTLSEIESSIQNIKTGSAQDTETAILNYKLQIDAAENAYNTAVNNFKKAEFDLEQSKVNTANKNTNAESQVTIKEAQLASAKADLALKKSPVRESDLAPLAAQIALAKIALEIAQNEKSDSQLVSPIDGTITFIYGKVGENISLSETALSAFLTIQVDDLIVEANVPETDISKIKTGNKVEMTIDAFDFTEKFEGSVIYIDRAETTIQGVVYYGIKTIFDIKDERLKPGMTTNLEIITAEKNNVLIIPARAVNFEDSVRYVQLLRNGTPEKVIIETGLESDEFVEVTSGLKEGDQIITFVR